MNDYGYGYDDMETTMSRRDVLRLMADHNITTQEFEAEFGSQEVYDTGAVMCWLGY